MYLKTYLKTYLVTYLKTYLIIYLKTYLKTYLITYLKTIPIPRVVRSCLFIIVTYYEVFCEGLTREEFANIQETFRNRPVQCKYRSSCLPAFLPFFLPAFLPF